MADTGKWDPKDPDEVKDYEFDWTDILDGDTISSSIWILPSGTLVKNSDTKTTTTTTIWLSAGSIGQSYPLLNRIVTAGGRTYDRTRKLKMKSL